MAPVRLSRAIAPYCGGILTYLSRTLTGAAVDYYQHSIRVLSIDEETLLGMSEGGGFPSENGAYTWGNCVVRARSLCRRHPDNLVVDHIVSGFDELLKASKLLAVHGSGMKDGLQRIWSSFEGGRSLQSGRLIALDSLEGCWAPDRDASLTGTASGADPVHRISVSDVDIFLDHQARRRETSRQYDNPGPYEVAL